MSSAVAARVTERPNPITKDIDVASPEGILRLLRQSDAQLFAGYDTFPGLLDAGPLGVLCKVAGAVEAVVSAAGPHDVIVCSGAGTSGRLAHFASKSFNSLLAHHGRTQQLFKYVCAGGDASLLEAQENAEDNPNAATDDLAKVLPPVESGARVIYIGITCGLSATYVGAQLAHCFTRDDVACVLVGFNPADTVRPVAITGWDLTFTDIVDRMTAPGAEAASTAWGAPKFMLMNPIVGPESVTGSTRMKGGSATKIVVETAFYVGCTRGVGAVDVPLRHMVLDVLGGFQAGVRAAYLPLPTIAAVLQRAGHALSHGGRVVYAGAGTPGILSIIDASECPPTFGALYDDVRGYVVDGYSTFAVHAEQPFAAPDMEASVHLDTAHCVATVLPALTPDDLLVLVGYGDLGAVRGSLGEALPAAAARGVPVATILATVDGGGRGEGLDVVVPLGAAGPPGCPSPMFAELALKLVLNAVSTGGHIEKGSVYQNRMVSLQLSNVKLFHRATALVCTIGGAAEAAAVRALIRAIHGVDDVPPALRDAPLGDHVSVATTRLRVVPLALLLVHMEAAGGAPVPVADAEARLARQPIIRSLVLELTGGEEK